jgi:membrane associated rhomboid family serine protease
LDKTLHDFTSALKFSGIVVSVLWIVHIYAYASQSSLTYLGVFPREADGLIGIFTAPLIHGSWEHLISNSVPLFVSTTIIHYFYKRVVLSSFFLIYFLTGFAVWLFGRSVYHIGASGVVYGLIAFIFWSGVFRRNIKSIVLALIVTILYAGYLEGVVPFQEGISWESHLMGVIVGLLIAFFLKEIIEKDEIKTDPWADEDDEAEFFLERNVFEKTKEERRQDLLDEENQIYL